jgi:hypothetical protein
MKVLLLIVAVFTIFMVNTTGNVIARLGFESAYWIAGLIALAVAGLIRDQGPVMIILVLFTGLVANMPQEFILNFGIDRDYFFGAFVGLVLTPTVVNSLE